MDLLRCFSLLLLLRDLRRPLKKKKKRKEDEANYKSLELSATVANQQNFTVAVIFKKKKKPT